LKHIAKGNEPVELAQRRGEIKGLLKLKGDWYQALGSKVDPDGPESPSVVEVVKRQCISEQKHLCAYTMMRIEMETSHLEHMFPQSQCSMEESIDYKNIVACFPHSDNPQFGAMKKADWPAKDQRHLFVKPTDANCESRFAFMKDGKIEPAQQDDEAALETIARINLNHPTLKKHRADEFKSLFKLDKLEALLNRKRQLTEQRNGKLEEYITGKLTITSERIDALKRRRKFARQQSRNNQ